MAGASQLGIFNDALGHIGERKLANVNERREPARYLLDEWTNAVDVCLSKAFWNWSLRMVQLSAETTITPLFGYIFAFQKPSDWERTFIISDNDIFEPPLKIYHDENNYWYANITPLYVRYVSNDPNRGPNMALWTPGFVEFIGAYLAWKIAPRITQAVNKADAMDKIQKSLFRSAAARDAMDLPPGRPPIGTWVASRAPRGSIYPMGGNLPWSR